MDRIGKILQLYSYHVLNLEETMIRFPSKLFKYEGVAIIVSLIVSIVIILIFSLK